MSNGQRQVQAAILELVSSRGAAGLPANVIWAGLDARGMVLSRTTVVSWLEYLRGQGLIDKGRDNHRWRRTGATARKSTGRRGSPPAWLPQAITLYSKDHEPAAAIGRRFGVAGSTVLAWLRQSGVEIRRQGPQRGTGRASRPSTPAGRRLNRLENAARDVLAAYQVFLDTDGPGQFRDSLTALQKALGDRA